MMSSEVETEISKQTEERAICPICNKLFPTSSLPQHANICIDSISSPKTEHKTIENGQENHDGDEDFDDIQINIPSPPPSPPSSSDSDSNFEQPLNKKLKEEAQIKPSMKQEKQEKKGKTEGRTEGTAIAHWLQSIGLYKYTSGLLLAGYRTVSDFQKQPPTDKSLRSYGLSTLGSRRKLLSAISSIASTKTESKVKQEPKKVEDELLREQEEKPKRKVWAIFEPGYTAKSTSPLKRPRTSNNSNSNNNKTNSTSTDKDKKFMLPNANIKFHPYSQRVPNTSFVVDSFGPSSTDKTCTTYFLTHFHSDHYGGLRKKSFPSNAKIFCSEITSKLLKLQLSIPDNWMKILEYEKEIKIKDQNGNVISLWTFDANHCPGAIIMLFYIHHTKRYILHTGDCRFDMSKFTKFQKLTHIVNNNQLDYLYLDTTYCNIKYSFPYQQSILDQVVEIAKYEDKRTKKRCIFFFGTYSIGKEKVFLAVANALNLKIYGNKRKQKILDCLNLGSQYTSRLVDDPKQARVQVIPMKFLSAGYLTQYAIKNGLNKDFIGRGLAIVIRPTGWTFNNGINNNDNIDIPKGQSRQIDQAVVYNISYSEHSSYKELKQFVEWAKPTKLIPTVNARSKEAADKLRELLGHVDRPLRSVD